MWYYFEVSIIYSIRPSIQRGWQSELAASGLISLLSLKWPFICRRSSSMSQLVFQIDRGPASMATPPRWADVAPGGGNKLSQHMQRDSWEEWFAWGKLLRRSARLLFKMLSASLSFRTTFQPPVAASVSGWRLMGKLALLYSSIVSRNFLVVWRHN